MSTYCRGNQATCPCLKHSNLRSFYSSTFSDAHGKDYDNIGRKYEFLDPLTLVSNQEKQEINIFGFSLKGNI